MLPYFQVLPIADVLFQDYFFLWIKLILVNGVTNVVATVLVLINKKTWIHIGNNLRNHIDVMDYHSVYHLSILYDRFAAFYC